MRDLRTDRRLSAVTLLLKDALRSARFTLRRGRDLMEPPAPTPAPVGEAARAVLASVDLIALRFDDMARAIGGALLDLDARTDGPAPILTRLRGRPGDQLVFAQLAYRGGLRALKRLGARDAMLSEANAAAAFLAVGRSAGDPPSRAAGLFRALRAGGFVRDVARRPAGRLDVTSDDVEALTIFAVVLWMLAEPGAEPTRGDAVLIDCCDLALALQEPLRAAETRGDDLELGALLARYGDKV